MESPSLLTNNLDDIDNVQPAPETPKVHILNLPYSILAHIFAFLDGEDPTTVQNAAQASRTIYALYKDPVVMAEFFIRKYGRALALSAAISKHSRLLSLDVVRTMVENRDCLLPRYMAQKLGQGFGGSACLHTSIIAYLLEHAVTLYGDFRPSPDDYAKIDTLFRHIIFAEDGDTMSFLSDPADIAISERANVELAQILTEGWFMPIPNVHYRRDPYGFSLSPQSFETPLFFMTIFAREAFDRIICLGYSIAELDINDILFNFIEEGQEHAVEKSVIANGIDFLIDRRVIRPNRKDISSIFLEADLEDDLEVLRLVKWGIPVSDIVRDIWRELLETPIDSDIHCEDIYLELYAASPCPDLIAEIILRRYGLSEESRRHPDLENFSFGLPESTCLWLLSILLPHHPRAVSALFDQLVLSLAAAPPESSRYNHNHQDFQAFATGLVAGTAPPLYFPHNVAGVIATAGALLGHGNFPIPIPTVDYGYFDTHPSKRLSTLEHFIDAGVRLHRRHIQWFRFTRTEHWWRAFLDLVRRIGVLLEDDDIEDCEQNTILSSPSSLPLFYTSSSSIPSSSSANTSRISSGGLIPNAPLPHDTVQEGLVVSPDHQTKARRRKSWTFCNPLSTLPSSSRPTLSSSSSSSTRPLSPSQHTYLPYLRVLLEDEKLTHERLAEAAGVRKTRFGRGGAGGRSVFLRVLEEFISMAESHEGTDEITKTSSKGGKGRMEKKRRITNEDDLKSSSTKGRNKNKKARA